MNQNYKNSYKVTEKELVSLSVYNVGFQKCDPLYQWGPGIRDHYLIHYIISGKGYYKIKNTTFTLQTGDSFLVYPNTEVLYFADETDPWEYAWVGFTGSDASMILKATDFSTERPVIEHTPLGESIHRQILHIYDARGNEFEHAVEMTGRLYTMLALFMHGATTNTCSDDSLCQWRFLSGRVILLMTCAVISGRSINMGMMIFFMSSCFYETIK